MSTNVTQLSLIDEAVEHQEVPLATILKQPDLLAAYNLCINVSGKGDKAFCAATGIDQGNWSLMRRGIKRHFPTNSLDPIILEAGNVIPLIWQCYRHGFNPPEKRQDAKDVEIAALRAQLDEAQKEMAIVRKWLKGAKG